MGKLLKFRNVRICDTNDHLLQTMHMFTYIPNEGEAHYTSTNVPGPYDLFLNFTGMHGNLPGINRNVGNFRSNGSPDISLHDQYPCVIDHAYTVAGMDGANKLVFTTNGLQVKIYPIEGDDTRYILFTFSDNASSQWQFYKDGALKFTYGGNLFYSQSYTSGSRPYYSARCYMCSLPWWVNESLGVKSVGVRYDIRYYRGESSAERNFASIDCDYGVSDATLATWNSWIGDYEPQEVDPLNPYSDGGTSTTGGGGGNFSDTSDDVDVDQLPSIDAIGTGFATLFTPSKTQLTNLAGVMWDSNVFTALQNLVENITGMFTSLAIVPFQVTAGQTVEVTWFGLSITNIFLTLASQQYYEFDMGSIDLANDTRIFTSGSALDYSPYSKLGIFLPFIGYQDLDIDECRDAVIGLKYRIDILSGTCVALISINGNTIYQFTGNCLSQIPITNENMQSLVTDAVNVGIAAAATHSAMGAASADMAAAEGSTKMSEAAKEAKVAHAQAHVSSSAGQLSSATANAAMGMKPSYGKAGAISASASLLAVKQPYLFLTSPRQSMPEHYQRYCGFPSNISGKLSTFSGFTVVEDIRLNGLVATSPEVSEIYELLKKGVII